MTGMRPPVVEVDEPTAERAFQGEECEIGCGGEELVLEDAVLVEQPHAFPVVADPVGYILGELRRLNRRHLEACCLLWPHSASQADRIEDERPLVRLLQPSEEIFGNRLHLPSLGGSTW